MNVLQEFTTLTYTIGDNFTIRCNIEVGVNTAQTRFIVNIYRLVIFDSRENITERVIQYAHNVSHPTAVSITRTTTMYTFHPLNLTTDVMNFSIPYPEQAREVKYFCTFYTIVNSRALTEQTTTVIIPKLRKLIKYTHIL